MDWKSIRIEQDDNLPYYMQLAREIRRLILTGRIQLGERIPVSRELMKIFKFSSTTVEKGIGILVEEGFLVRRRAVGNAQPDGTFELMVLRSEAVEAQKYILDNNL